MKNIFFVFFLLAINVTEGQIFFDFELDDLENWSQFPENRWEIDSLSPVEGNYSLHHSYDNQDAGRDRLSFPASFSLKDTSLLWRFMVKYDYNPSGSNNWGFFLVSDQDAAEMHPSGSTNGYLVGVNYSGSDDCIKLWRISSGSGYEILNTGFNWQETISPGQTVGFEIAFNNGSWKLRVDKTGGYSRLKDIGETTDTNFGSSQYAGIYHEYTSSADQRLWFDNIYIGAPVKDTIPPGVTATNVIHSTALNIGFSESMDSSSLIKPSNFQLINGDKAIDTIFSTDTLHTKVRLIFDKPLTDSFEYKLSLSNLQDLSGNILQDTVLSFIYEKLRVDTMMVTAADSLLFCFSRAVDTASAKNTENYTISPGTGFPSEVIFPADKPSCMLVALNKPLQPGKAYQINIDGITDTFNDTMVPHTGSIYFSKQSPYDVVINEIMADPYPSVELPEAEYIELYNRTSEAVDLEGWRLIIENREKHLPPGIIQPQQYMILCDEEYSGEFSSYGNVLPFPVFPVLRNSDSEISLLNTKGILMDSVSYHESWYRDEEKEDGGYSLERIDPENHCSGMTNWRVSHDARGGTPGNRNSVYAENIDTVPPRISYFETVTDYQIRIKFTEPVASEIADDEQNYFVDGAPGPPYSVILKEPVQKEILLLFREHFDPDLEYTLHIDRIADECGNQSVNLARNFTHHPVRPFDVVINEIMADPEPSMGLPPAEYVELYNNSNYEISLSGWKIVMGNSSEDFGDLSIPPNGYCILCDAESEEAFSRYGKVWGLDHFPAITNSGEPVVLEDRSGEIISFIDFSEEWYEDEYKKEGGWSLEQIDPENPCGGKENWAASKSKDGGTPARKNSIFAENPDNESIKPSHVTIPDSVTLLLHFNEPYDRATVEDDIFRVNGMGKPSSVLVQPPGYSTLKLIFDEAFEKNVRYKLIIRGKVKDCAGNEIRKNSSLFFELPEPPQPGDLVINEVLFNPAFDGVDFVEIYNRSAKTVDLKAVCLATIDETTSETERVSCLSSSGRLFFPEEYMVYTTNPEKVMEQYPAARPDRFVVTHSFPSYPDDAGTVLLIDKWMQPLDRLDYTKKMHFPLLKDPEGVSLERVNPDRPSDDQTNWHSASRTSGYGTPTYKNSQFAEQSDSKSAITLKPEVFSPDNDGKDDFLNIHYQFENPGYVATIRIYDSKGRMVRHLVNNQTVGTEGFFTWDGLDDQRRKAKMGIYVVYMKVYNPQGSVKSFKETCVVAGRL
jgi:hypothetical protein